MSKSRVIMTLGCPGSGKSTFAQKCDPKSVVLCLDDFRTALFRDKQFYHNHATIDRRMQGMLNDAYEGALRTALGYGFNVILANMHVYPRSVEPVMTICRRFNVVPELWLFDPPLIELLARNETRPEADRVPEDFLRKAFDDMHADDAWWRTYKGPVIRPVEMESA